jgi:hypothetical protein
MMIDRATLVRILMAGLTLAGAAACGGGGTPETREIAASAKPATTAGSPPAAAGPGSGCTQEVVVPAHAVATHDMKWKDGVGHGVGTDPHVIFMLPNRVSVCGVRLQFTLTTPDGAPALFQVFWTKGGVEFGKNQQNATLNSSAQGQTFTVWINDEIDSLRVDPNTNPVDFKMSEIVILMRPGASPR